MPVEPLEHELAEVVESRLAQQRQRTGGGWEVDRKSTRLNSSHSSISYAVFCFPTLRALPSFPTRRSSDLRPPKPAGTRDGCLPAVGIAGPMPGISRPGSSACQ